MFWHCYLRATKGTCAQQIDLGSGRPSRKKVKISLLVRLDLVGLRHFYRGLPRSKTVVEGPTSSALGGRHDERPRFRYLRDWTLSIPGTFTEVYLCRRGPEFRYLSDWTLSFSKVVLYKKSPTPVYRCRGQVKNSNFLIIKNVPHTGVTVLRAR